MIRRLVGIHGLVAVCAVCMAVQRGHAGEVGFVEDFALAKDRDEALKQLVPGTRDYYFYTALHFQNNEQYDKVEDVLKLWIKRYGHTSRVWMIKNRQALLTYERNAAASLAYLRSRMNVHFNHHRESLTRESNRATVLNPSLISRQTLMRRATRYRNTAGFEDRALDWLIQSKLTPDRRRHLLQRLQRPDYPNLVNLVLEDMAHKYSRGFGSMNIHRAMLKSQLDELLKRKPDLRNKMAFVQTYLTKLWPTADVEWRHNDEEYAAYLERLWAFVSTLQPVHNSLKAHVLYHQLAFHRKHGRYDANRFMQYIKLPRNVYYVNPNYLKTARDRRYPVQLGQGFPQTMLSTIGNDEPLVRAYLHHFFKTADNFKKYEPYLRDTYLKQHFAETKIVNGLGDPESWYSMLSPSQVQQLKDRVDIDFDSTNRSVFGANEPVSLGLHVKNVKKLLVKVYRINAAKYYRDTYREIDTDINLDGLVANEESTHAYEEPPLRRMRRQFDFPQMREPGVYVVDFIGNGRSSRVLVRKGRLRHKVDTTPAGHLITVLDGTNQMLKDASVAHGGRVYQTDKNGQVMIPFSNRPGRQPLVLMHGKLASLDYFQQQSENYQLEAGIYVDRENVLKHNKAKVIIRPRLLLNGQPTSLKLLEDVRLTLSVVDHDGTPTTKQVPGFEIFEDREATYEFFVPARVSRLGVALSAKVEVVSQGGTKRQLQSGSTFTLNAIDQSDHTQALHLTRVAGKYLVEVRGKSGEPRQSQGVNIELKHQDFKNSTHVSLQTDARGRVLLGNLRDIDWIRVSGTNLQTARWELPDDTHTNAGRIHARVGETIQVPVMETFDAPQRNAFSLLEKRGSTFVADRFDALAMSNGFLTLSKLPAGDYDLFLKGPRQRIQIAITDGKEQDGWAMGSYRLLERRNAKPLQIASAAMGPMGLKIALQNTTPQTRVHVIAARYLPRFRPQDRLYGGDRDPSGRLEPSSVTSYIVGRDIGDEYRYILERRYAKKFPGNMLTRPELLLNPWEVRTTQTGRQQAKAGSAFGGRGDQQAGAGFSGRAAHRGGGGAQDFVNLDFLPQGSVILENLSPDKDGVIAVKKEELAGLQDLHIVAVDPLNTAYRSFSTDETELKSKDLRLLAGLDPQKDYTEQQQVDLVTAGKSFAVDDITTSQHERYDSLSRIYRLFSTITNDSKLAEFDFVAGWNKLTKAQKTEKYSKYACHELSFFISKRDPEFFRQVVKPYLANKRHPTFMDHYLLGADLTAYASSWEYQRLNVVERVLLSQRLASDRPYAAKHLQELYEMLPPQIDRWEYLFNTALKNDSLDADDEGAMEEMKALEKADESMRRSSRLRGLRMEREQSAMKPMSRPMPTAAAPKDKMASNFEASAPAEPVAEAMDDSATDRDMRNSKRKKSGYASAKGKVKNSPKKEAVYYKSRQEARKQVRQYYRKLEKTKEWAENNYYKLPIQQQTASLITVNSFWRDFAAHDPGQPFFSKNVADASRNFTEMMFAMSVLDLPFESKEHQIGYKGAKMDFKAASPSLVFHRQIRPAERSKEPTSILVSQNFFRHGDRYRIVNGQRVDKYVADEFLVNTVYGAQVVVTNPTSARQKLSILLQVPEGAVPVMRGRYTRAVRMQIQPYSTQQILYHFYFPATGKFAHYPVRVAKDEKVIAAAPGVELNVVAKLTKIDKGSWQWISQFGTDDQVIEYLKTRNIQEIDLAKIAWRMKNANYFDVVTTLLRMRHAYNHTLWSYALMHNNLGKMQEYLKHSNGFLQQCGPYLVSKPVTIDPVVRHLYEHLEYSPLVNARAHQLGKRRQIVNERVLWQYNRLLNITAYKREMNDDDLMAATYHMTLQDRVDEAQAFFKRVNRQKLKTQIQYDYFTAYLDFFNEQPTVARAVADKYADYPVDRWRKRFKEVANQLDEIEGKVGPKAADDKNRDQVQAELAAATPSFEFQVESRQVKIKYQNLKSVRVNYYLMDIELMFSRKPFVQAQDGAGLSYVQPNASVEVQLPADQPMHGFDLPERFRNSNVLIEISGAGKIKSQAYFANSLAVQMIEDFGQVKVTHEKTNRALSKVYVKVYARLANGQVRFYKDGYTDLRGRFDYSSLNTDELDSVQRFAVLVYSDKHGAVIKEATPPKR